LEGEIVIARRNLRPDQADNSDYLSGLAPSGEGVEREFIVIVALDPVLAGLERMFHTVNYSTLIDKPDRSSSDRWPRAR
jgi:hypothetical protein